MLKKAWRSSTCWSSPTRIPTAFSAVSRTGATTPICLPVCTQFESAGSRTASNRSLQWRDKVVEPIFESKYDHEIMYLFAKKLGFADEMFKHIKVDGTKPLAEDILREINRGTCPSATPASRRSG